MSISVPHNRLAVTLLCACALLTGCSFFNNKQASEKTQTWKEVFGTAGPEIVDASRASRKTIQIEVTYLEQPLSDLSMIDLLWKEVDQIGALDSKTRNKLKENNLRVGIAGPNIPRTLQKLLKVDAAWREERSEGRQGSTAQSITIFPEEPTHLLTGQAYQQCEIEIPKASGKEKISFNNMNCQFQIEAEELGDGWVKLHFIPEIHHEAKSLRRIATEDGWQFRNGKKQLPVYDQKFTLMLNKGEVAVISAAKNQPGSLGHAMFIGDGQDDQIQKAIVVRLLDINQARAKLSREGTY